MEPPASRCQGPGCWPGRQGGARGLPAPTHLTAHRSAVFPGLPSTHRWPHGPCLSLRLTQKGPSPLEMLTTSLEGLPTTLVLPADLGPPPAAMVMQQAELDTRSQGSEAKGPLALPAVGEEVWEVGPTGRRSSCSGTPLGQSLWATPSKPGRGKPWGLLLGHGQVLRLLSPCSSLRFSGTAQGAREGVLQVPPPAPCPPHGASLPTSRLWL